MVVLGQGHKGQTDSNVYFSSHGAYCYQKKKKATFYSNYPFALISDMDLRLHLLGVFCALQLSQIGHTALKTFISLYIKCKVLHCDEKSSPISFIQLRLIL